ncbi:aldo/keto reductase [Mobilicoccus pelagius]|uniref:Putative aldo/keto reductase n=1 Tax=Mobilicoccus pelagius NBRC 104925 TaxID=1089455 RepID=H5UMF8_9MICO|nr:aldo/keto reductase [Mobilicoccus pelagius]GAB46916.1 putative aldo/keto reductase [Mobilicoccus pelagius NBRC 104925]
MTTSVPTLTLRAGDGTVDIPQLGFGTWEIPDEDVTDAVLRALKTGYRSIDTAAIYGNEEGVGRALRQTEIPREDIFLTTKVWNDRQGFDSTLEAMDESLAKLGTDYVDLYLIHWPTPAKDAYVDTWKALLELRKRGKAKAVGVCNFHAQHLQRLADETGELPAVNQIEVHPYLAQNELRTFNAEHDIVTEDWSPLGARLNIIEDPVVGSIANATGKTPAQVILRWHLQIGSVVIPRSTKPTRIESNFGLFDFELTDAQLDSIRGLDENKRSGPDPDEFNVGA